MNKQRIVHHCSPVLSESWLVFMMVRWPESSVSLLPCTALPGRGWGPGCWPASIRAVSETSRKLHLSVSPGPAGDLQPWPAWLEGLGTVEQVSLESRPQRMRRSNSSENASMSRELSAMILNEDSANLSR